MRFLQLVKNSILHFNELKNAKNIGFGKMILYLLLLSLIAAIPITLQVRQVFSDIQSDGQEIAEQIPDFTVEDGKMQTNEQDGFIYQTDSIIFTFDPKGQRTSDDISKDMIGNFLSVGLLQEEAVLSLQSNEATEAILGDNQFELSYDDSRIQNLTGEMIQNELSQSKLPWWTLLVALLVATYPSFINLIVILLITTIIGNLYSRIQRTSNRFLDNLKIMIASATLPVIIGAVINSFSPGFDSTMLIAILAFFIFMQAIKSTKKIE
ncbi:DUF1189 domain-containing protein [Tetragenococcus halophilus]|uniref:DUF1189 domain-containing protein n=1 Tax=Tetragenococcus halophilus TaxID=51669 RepID=UPI000B92644E|nr:DUF1189 domain-containing protein [Tetragenococcus halophilus]NWO00074.1 DUF1189 domain-containing protein [Tetragenococcus halophilus]